MTTEEIKQGNELIAKFMGYQIDDTKQFFPYTHFYKMTTDKYTYDQLDIGNVRSYTEGFVFGYRNSIEKRYDNSWDWIMPVVRRINEICHADDEEEFFCSDEYTSILEVVPLADIESSYRVVLEFIKWYNENK